MTKTKAKGNLLLLLLLLVVVVADDALVGGGGNKTSLEKTCPSFSVTGVDMGHQLAAKYNPTISAFSNAYRSVGYCEKGKDLSSSVVVVDDDEDVVDVLVMNCCTQNTTNNAMTTNMTKLQKAGLHTGALPAP